MFVNSWPNPMCICSFNWLQPLPRHQEEEIRCITWVFSLVSKFPESCSKTGGSSGTEGSIATDRVKSIAGGHLVERGDRGSVACYLAPRRTQHVQGRGLGALGEAWNVQHSKWQIWSNSKMILPSEWSAENEGVWSGHETKEHADVSTREWCLYIA